MAVSADRTFDLLFPTETTSAEETMRFGSRLAGILRPGDVLALYGDLGAGKTQLAKGICTHLGVPPETVTSPTFTIVNEYSDATPLIFHIDAYRIQHREEMIELGFDSYLDEDAICIIEWPENIESSLPAGTLRIELAHITGNVRRITLR